MPGLVLLLFNNEKRIEEAPANFLPICNSRRFYKRQEIRSSVETHGSEPQFSALRHSLLSKQGLSVRPTLCQHTA